MEEKKTQEYFGVKELHSVVLRAFDKMTIGNKEFDEGEPILYFEKIQIGQLGEGKIFRAARGGHGNYPHVIWESFTDMKVRLTEGVVSKMGLGILSSTGLLEKEAIEENAIKVPKRETLEVQEGKVTTMQEPLEEKIFIYILENGIITKRIKDFNIFENIIEIGEEYNGESIIVDYYFNYKNSYNQYIFGSKRIDGLLSLEGKAYFKDDINGLDRTFLFEMPKIKITSNLEMKIGEQASPMMSVFDIVGLPIKENGQWVISKMNLLDDDIDADI